MSIRVGLGLAAVLAMVSPAFAQDNDDDDEPLATGFVATTQTLRDDGAHTVYYVPFEPAAGVDPATIRWDVIGVSIGTLDRRELTEAFRAKLEVAEGRTRLAVGVDFSRFERPATYAVEVQLTGPVPAAAPDGGVTAAPRQRVTLTFEHPGAELRATGTWIIWRTRGVMGDSDEPATFPIGEKSRRSQLTAVTAVQVDHAKLGEEHVSGRLEVTAPATIAPGTVEQATVALKGTFPLGTTKGTVEIDAPQLADPVVVNYEVRTRAPGWYVIPIFLIAGFLGWLFRVHLKQREERLALEKQGELALRRLDEAMAADPPSRDKLGPPRNELAEAIDDRESARLTKAIESAGEALAGVAVARLEVRSGLITTARANVEMLGRRWMLPPGFELAAAAGHFVEAEQLALDDQLAAAQVASKAGATAVADLVRKAAAWRARMIALLAVLEKPAPKVPEDVATEWTASATAMRTAIEALPGDDNPGKTPTIDDLLGNLHTAQSAALAGLSQAAGALAAAADLIGDELRGTADSEAHIAAIAAAARIDLTAAGADAPAGFARLAPAVRALIKAIRDAISALYKPDDLGPLDETLATGDYLKAVVDARPKTARRDLADDDGGAPSAQRRFDRGRAAATPPPTAGASVVVVTRGAGERWLTARHARTLRALMMTQALRGLIAIGVITAGAYYLYSGAFIGTMREVLGLAAVAFSTEFTVEHGLEILSKGAPSEG